ncbi:MAG: molecular chaperone DnaJ [Acidimicrobiales bacterium]
MTTVQREWFEKDYYKALGVGPKATEAEIRRAYRKLAKQNHPDANPGREDRFKEVSAAYEVLSDTEKRTAYDEARRLGPAAAGGMPGGFGGAGGPGGTFNFGAEDLGDLLGGLFGRSRGGGRPPGRRGADLEASLTMSFLESLDGVTTTVNITGEATCSACHGSGAAAGSTPVVCGRCSGRGMLADNQGLFSLSRPCPDCRGRGMKVESPCPRCSGTGSERRSRPVKVRIPAGVDDGQKIRLKGRGAPGSAGGPPGDLFVTVGVTPHSLFRRRGRDLTLNVPITFAEAALGAEISVPTLDRPAFSASESADPSSLGAPVVLRVPAGTRSGRTFRIRGRGVPDAKGSGDLLVSVEVAVPTKLNDAQRRAIEALAEATTDSPRAHLSSAATQGAGA